MRVELGVNQAHDHDEGERAEPGANARAGQARRARARAGVRRCELGGRKQKTVDALLHDRTRDTSGFYTTLRLFWPFSFNVVILDNGVYNNACFSSAYKLPTFPFSLPALLFGEQACTPNG